MWDCSGISTVWSISQVNRALLDQEIAGFFPGYFALVMATGIVSIASSLLGLRLVAQALFAVNIIA